MTERMDLNISGSSTMPGGEYKKVSISGAGKLTGSVHCERIQISGSGMVDGDVICEGKIDCSGAAKIMGRLEGGSLEASGAFKVEKDCVLRRDLEVSGASEFHGSLTANRITFSGAITCDEDVTAESFLNAGLCQIRGLLNAETVEIKLSGDCEIGDIGGSSILVRPEHRRGFFRLRHCELRTGTIEGDNIDLEKTIANTVRGSAVRIGPACRIRRVEYTESLVVSPDAEVKERVQVGARAIEDHLKGIEEKN